MKLIEKILSDENLAMAIVKVKGNKGAPGIDNMTVSELNSYFDEHGEEIKSLIMDMKYEPKCVKRVYIPKSNGKSRPLGIPVVVDRVIQQAIAYQLGQIYEPLFSDHSHGFRPERSCQGAIDLALGYLNEGYDWVIDLDIEKFFDTVNHDKLISILREQVNDKVTLNLIRKYLKAGIFDNGQFHVNEFGMPQGSNLSPVLSNIYLDKLDKELELRGLRFARYADDVCIFVRTKYSADRVMKSISKWLKVKLFLNVSPTKTKVVRPSKSEFLGFCFWKNGKKWQTVPSKRSKARLYENCRQYLLRKRGCARHINVTIEKINQKVRGWLNYYRYSRMKTFIRKFGMWLRHKIRVIIIKQWKRSKTIYRNLSKINRIMKCNKTDEQIYKVAYSGRGLYARCNGDVINFLLSPKLLQEPNIKTGRKGLINPLEYYLDKTVR